MGPEIKRRRRAKGWSQTELGRQVTPQVSRSAVQKWESGASLPSGDEVYRLLEIVPPDRGTTNGGTTAAESCSPAIRRGSSTVDLTVPAAELVANLQAMAAELSRRIATGELSHSPEVNGGITTGGYDVDDIPAGFTPGEHVRDTKG